MAEEDIVKNMNTMSLIIDEKKKFNSPEYYYNKLIELLGCEYTSSGKYLPLDVINIIIDYIMFVSECIIDLKTNIITGSGCLLSDNMIVMVLCGNGLRVFDINHQSVVIDIKHTYPVHVNSLGILPDGRVVGCSGGEIIFVWNTISGKLEQTLHCASFSVYSLCVLSDGRVVSQGDKIIRVWNLETCLCDMILEGHTGSITSVYTLPDGRVASTSWDSTIRVWNLVDGKCDLILEGHTEAVFCVCYVGNNHIATGSLDKSIRVWSLIDGKCDLEISHNSGVRKLCFLPDGRLLGIDINKTFEERLCLWDLSNGNMSVLKKYNGFAGSLHILNDGRVVTMREGEVQIWK
jgi:WD40 repeat protein